MTPARARTPGVDSARRVLKVLLLFSEERSEVTAEEIARDVGVSLPSAYRFISLLREVDLLEENGSNGYVLSPRVFSLASSAEQGLKISSLLRPLVESLSTRTGEAALVIRRVGDFATCAEISQTEHAIRLSFAPGHIMSLHRGAGPKMLLASMGRDWARRYFDRIDPRPGPAERDTLLAELDDITALGWARSAAEVDEGVWAVAAPITAANKVIAAVTVAGPQFRIDKERAARILDEIIASAAEVSRSLSR